MKIERYSVCKPSFYAKSFHVLVKEEGTIFHHPLIYLQRPKWIKDDKAWETIVKSVKLDLPVGFEIK